MIGMLGGDRALSQAQPTRVLVLSVCFAGFAAASSSSSLAADARNITPGSGQVGHTVNVHGDGLRGTSFEVKFGNAPASNVRNPGRSDQDIKMDVPNKISPSDPDTVVVTVKIDGVEAQYPNGPLRFTYQIPQPAPAVATYEPAAIEQNTGFVITFGGQNFVLAQRSPQACYAFAQGGTQSLTVSSDILGTPTNDRVSFFFPGLSEPGDYKFSILFSDAAGAELLASSFVRAVPADPVIADFTTDQAPVPAHTSFTVTFVGSNFTNAAGRAPTSVIAEGVGSPVVGLILDPPTPTAFSATFGSDLDVGSYVLKVTFTEGTSSIIVSATRELTVVP